MSIVGTWDVAIKSPMGNQVVTLDFADEHTGVARYPGGSAELSNLAVSGNDATWQVNVTSPMTLSLNCQVAIDGDTLSGTAAAGVFGTFPVTGTRTAPPSF